MNTDETVYRLRSSSGQEQPTQLLRTECSAREIRRRIDAAVGNQEASLVLEGQRIEVSDTTQVESLGVLPCVSQKPQRPGWARILTLCFLGLCALLRAVWRICMRALLPSRWLWPHYAYAQAFEFPKALTPGAVLLPFIGLTETSTSITEGFASQAAIYQKIDSPHAPQLMEEAQRLEKLAREQRGLLALSEKISQALDESPTFSRRQPSSEAPRPLPLNLLRALETAVRERHAMVTSKLDRKEAASLFYTNQYEMTSVHLIPQGSGNEVKILKVRLSLAGDAHRIETSEETLQRDQVNLHVLDAFHMPSLLENRVRLRLQEMDDNQKKELPSLCAAGEQQVQYGRFAAATTSITTERLLPLARFVEEVHKARTQTPLEMTDKERALFSAQQLISTVSSVTKSMWMFLSFKKVLEYLKFDFTKLEKMVDALEIMSSAIVPTMERITPKHQICTERLLWADQFAEMRAILSGSSKSPPRPVSLTAQHEKGAAPLASCHASALACRALRKNAAPASTPAEIHEVLSTSLEALDESAPPLVQRSHLLARLSGIQTADILRALGLNEGPAHLSYHGLQDPKLIALHPLMQRLREQLIPLLEETRPVALDAHEWWTVQQLNVLQAVAAEAQAQSILHSKEWIDCVAEAAEVLQGNHCGRALMGSEFFQKEWLEHAPEEERKELTFDLQMPWVNEEKDPSIRQQLEAAFRVLVGATMMKSDNPQKLHGLLERVRSQLESLDEVLGCVDLVLRSRRAITELLWAEHHSAFDYTPQQQREIQGWRQDLCPALTRLSPQEFSMNDHQETRLGTWTVPFAIPRMMLELSSRDRIPRPGIFQSLIWRFYGKNPKTILSFAINYEGNGYSPESKQNAEKANEYIKSHLRSGMDSWVHLSGDIYPRKELPQQMPWKTRGPFSEVDLCKEVTGKDFKRGWSNWKNICGQASEAAPYLPVTPHSMAPEERWTYQTTEEAAPEKLYRLIRGCKPSRTIAQHEEGVDGSERNYGRTQQGTIAKRPLYVWANQLIATWKVVRGGSEPSYDDDLQLALAADTRLPVEQRHVIATALLLNTSRSDRHLLHDPYLSGLYVRLTACPSERVLEGDQAASLTVGLQEIISLLPDMLQQGRRTEALRYVAWVARAMVHLPERERGALLEKLQEAQPLLRNLSIWEHLLASYDELEIGPLHDFLRAAMWLDTPLVGGNPLAQLSTPEKILSLRIRILKESPQLARPPINGPEAEWCRDARDHYLDVWHPSMTALSEAERVALERGWAKEFLSVEQELPGRGERAADEAVEFALASGGKVRVDLNKGAVQVEGLPQQAWSPSSVPTGAYLQIPCLAEFLGKRSVVFFRYDERGQRRFRICGNTEEGASWVDLIEAPQGFELEGHFRDPLASSGSAPQDWRWRSVPKKEQGSYPLLDFYGCWVATERPSCARLLVTAEPCTAMPQETYEVRMHRLFRDDIEQIRGPQRILLPFSSKQKGSAHPLLRLAMAGKNVTLQGSASGEIEAISLPTLGMEMEYGTPPSWARGRVGGKSWQVRWNGQHLVECPQLQRVAYQHFGSHSLCSCIPLIDEAGRAYLWSIPEGGKNKEEELRPICIGLTSSDPFHATLCTEDAPALISLFEQMLQEHQPRAAAVLSRMISKLSGTQLTEETKRALYKRLDRAVGPHDHLFRLRNEVLRIRWNVIQDIPERLGLQFLGWRRALESFQSNYVAIGVTREMMLDTEELATLQEAYPTHAIEVDTIQRMQQELFPLPAPSPLVAAPSLSEELLLCPYTQGIAQTPVAECVTTSANEEALAAVYAEQDKVYQRSLEQALSKQPDAGDTEADLRTSVHGLVASWRSQRASLQEQERLHREWLLLKVQHLGPGTLPGIEHLAHDLRWGDSARAEELLQLLMESWAQAAPLEETLAHTIQSLLQATCQRQQLDRLLAITASRSDSWDMPHLKQELRQAQELDKSFRQLADPLGRERLLMQAMRGIVIRSEQMEAVERMLEEGSSTLQLRPGFGKTDIIVPLVLKVARGRQQNWTVMVPEHLLAMSQQGLARSQRDLLVVQCNRSELSGSEGAQHARAWCERLRWARANHVPVLTTGETLAVVEVAIAEEQARKNQNNLATPLQLLQILRTSLRHGYHIIDEVDAVCAPNRKLVFAMGEVLPPPALGLAWARHFFALLSAQDGRQSKEVQALQGHFKHGTTATLLLERKEVVAKAVEELAVQALEILGCLQENIAIILDKESVLTEQKLGSEDLYELGKLVRQMVSKSLPQVFLGAFGREYGWSPERGIGVPYTEGEEEEETQFSFFADQLAFTMASAYFSLPITEEFLEKDWFHAVKVLEEHHEMTSSSHLVEQLKDCRKRAQEKNLKQDHADHSTVAEHLRSLLEQEEARELRLVLAERLFLPRLQTYQGSVARRMADIVRGLDNIKGITGTLRPKQLPTAFGEIAEDTYERESSVEVHCALLRAGTAPPRVLPNLQDAQQKQEALLALAGEYDVVLNQAGVAHGQGGSRSVARELAEGCGTSVAFYDPILGNRLLQRIRGHLYETPLRGAAPEGTKFYLGPHDLRGVNLIMPEGARAIYLPSPTVQDDSLEQAIRRLRKLNRNQTVDLCLPHGVAEALRDTQGEISVSAFLKDVLLRTQGEESRLESCKESNEQKAANFARENERWLTCRENVSTDDLKDVLENERPLVEEGWADAGWHPDELATSGGVERQVVVAHELQLGKEVSRQVISEAHRIYSSGLIRYKQAWDDPQTHPTLSSSTQHPIQSPACLEVYNEGFRASSNLLISSFLAREAKKAEEKYRMQGFPLEHVVQIQERKLYQHDYTLVQPLVIHKGDQKYTIQWLPVCSSSEEERDIAMGILQDMEPAQEIAAGYHLLPRHLTKILEKNMHEACFLERLAEIKQRPFPSPAESSCSLFSDSGKQPHG